MIWWVECLQLVVLFTQMICHLDNLLGLPRGHRQPPILWILKFYQNWKIFLLVRTHTFIIVSILDWGVGLYFRSISVITVKLIVPQIFVVPDGSGMFKDGPKYVDANIFLNLTTKTEKKTSSIFCVFFSKRCQGQIIQKMGTPNHRHSFFKGKECVTVQCLFKNFKAKLSGSFLTCERLRILKV